MKWMKETKQISAGLNESNEYTKRIQKNDQMTD